MFQGLDTLIGSASPSSSTRTSNVTVSGDGIITLKFAAEGASWIEFDSPNLGHALKMGAKVEVSISESRFIACNEAKTPTLHGNGTWRLELNKQL